MEGAKIVASASGAPLFRMMIATELRACKECS